MQYWTRLANELLYAIFDILPNIDLKNIRLTCRFLYAVTPLRFDRVYISSFRIDIDVLRSIAAHPVFSQQVREIVWDDTRLHLAELEDENNYTHHAMVIEAARSHLAAALEEAVDVIVLDQLFSLECDRIFESIVKWERGFHLLSRLRDEQRSIVRSGEDAEVFRMALAAFPRLRRVTITGHNHVARLYKTPLIRSLPDWLAEGWPGPGKKIFCHHIPYNVQNYLWRGYFIAIQELAKSPRSIPEFIVDRMSGTVNISIYDPFKGWNPHYEHFQLLMKRDSLKSLELTLNVHCLYTGLRSTEMTYGLFKLTLAGAWRLEHFRLNNGARYGYLTSNSLCDLFPVAEWRALRSFGLSRFVVRLEDLGNLLAAMPPTLSNLEFENVRIHDCSWEHTLGYLGHRLGWFADALSMPKVTIKKLSGVQPFKTIVIQEEVRRFYEGKGLIRLNPFTATTGDSLLHGNTIRHGFGRLRDDFDDSFDEPW